jgi:lipoprotein-releasing system ATP-binding protein
MSSLLEVRNVKRSYTQGEHTLDILKGINLSIGASEMVALVGQSGSGKTTLLQLLGLLDRPSSGEILLNGSQVNTFSDDARSKLRRKYLGFVFQFHHLLPEFTALENCVIPQMVDGKSRAQATQRASELLGELGLEKRMNHKPSELSGGEQQRVAIGRALVNDPALLLADEPTGNLDPETSEQVFSLLLKLTRDRGVGALIVTHNPVIAERMKRIVYMRNGLLADA